MLIFQSCATNVSGISGLPALNGVYSLSPSLTAWNTTVYSKGTSSKQYLYYDGNGQWLLDSDLNPASFYARTFSVAFCASMIPPFSSWLVYNTATSNFATETAVVLRSSNATCNVALPTCTDGIHNGYMQKFNLFNNNYYCYDYY